ncbi:MAG: hypothetical protein EOP53_22700 [Sphingobacteriales bacterium]|nr:MAG: hypothetical protein EOP53_22700 [Sphingobacteriales bacterium]
MEKKYRALLLLFSIIIVVSLAGFYRSYFSFFPEYNRFNAIIHFHFAVFICWFALIILQPVFIKRKQMRLHRLLGKFSYLVAVLMVITIALLTREKAIRELAQSLPDAAMTAFIGLADMVSFATCYVIALVNKRNTRWHVAFVICATLIVLNPGMARLLNGFNAGSGLLAAVLTPFLIPFIILLWEKIKLGRPMLKSPYLLFIFLWTVEIVLLITVPGTDAWQNLVKHAFA